MRARPDRGAGRDPRWPAACAPAQEGRLSSRPRRPSIGRPGSPRPTPSIAAGHYTALRDALADLRRGPGACPRDAPASPRNCVRAASRPGAPPEGPGHPHRRPGRRPRCARRGRSRPWPATRPGSSSSPGSPTRSKAARGSTRPAGGRSTPNSIGSTARVPAIDRELEGRGRDGRPGGRAPADPAPGILLQVPGQARPHSPPGPPRRLAPRGLPGRRLPGLRGRGARGPARVEPGIRRRSIIISARRRSWPASS